MEAGVFKWRGSCLGQDVEAVWSNSTLVLCVTPRHMRSLLEPCHPPG